MELERRSSGVAKADLATGITGAALGGLNSLTLLGITAGTTTTPQDTFNPIPQGNDCCCSCGN